jgi:hypothetical protein
MMSPRAAAGAVLTTPKPVRNDPTGQRSSSYGRHPNFPPRLDQEAGTAGTKLRCLRSDDVPAGPKRVRSLSPQARLARASDPRAVPHSSVPLRNRGKTSGCRSGIALQPQAQAAASEGLPGCQWGRWCLRGPLRRVANLRLGLVSGRAPSDDHFRENGCVSRGVFHSR